RLWSERECVAIESGVLHQRDEGTAPHRCDLLHHRRRTLVLHLPIQPEGQHRLRFEFRYRLRCQRRSAWDHNCTSAVARQNFEPLEGDASKTPSFTGATDMVLQNGRIYTADPARPSFREVSFGSNSDVAAACKLRLLQA